jgi:hypothetical protein
MLLPKQKIYDHFLGMIKTRLEAMQQKLDDLQESLKQETKSTAGDKYETGRAMVHMEQEQAGRQRSELLLQKAELESIDINTGSGIAAKGSLVATNRGYLFLSTGLGKAVIDGETVYALSTQSPLGQQLDGKSAGDTITMNGLSYLIRKVY